MDALTTRTDPIQRELVKYALEAAVGEMAVTIMRSAYSPTLRDIMDFSTALLSAGGEMIAQGLSLPLHLGAFPSAIRAVLEAYPGDLHEGDVFALNDPYCGGMHLPDVFLFRPVYFEGSLLGFAAVVGHQLDIGGRVPGGNACDSLEIYQEGLRIPPVRIVAGDVDSAEFWKFLRLNVRMSARVAGDLRAQIAALRVGERHLRALAQKLGRKLLADYTTELLDVSEAMARADIRAWPRGTYRFTDHIDDDGIDIGKPLHINVSVTVGDDVDISFEGSSPQARGAINSSLSSTVSAAMLAVRCVLPREIPNNAGFFRAIHVRAPEGSLVNSSPPAPVAARALTCFRVVDAVLGALALALPDRSCAAGDGGISILTFAGRRDDGSPFVLMDSVGCAWGARPDADGVDAVTPIALNLSNMPSEVVEREFPLLIEEHRLVPDTGGAGKFRGGLAQEKVYRFLLDGTQLHVRSDRGRYAPWGLAGGGSGATSANTLVEPDGTERPLPTKFSLTLPAGSRVRHRTAGAGGWGNPSERDPDLIARDLRLGKVTAARARPEHGADVG